MMGTLRFHLNQKTEKVVNKELIFPMKMPDYEDWSTKLPRYIEIPEK